MNNNTNFNTVGTILNMKPIDEDHFVAGILGRRCSYLVDFHLQSSYSYDGRVCYDSEDEAIRDFQRSCAARGNTRIAKVGEKYHITTLDSSSVIVPGGIDIRNDAIVIHLSDGSVVERRYAIVPTGD